MTEQNNPIQDKIDEAEFAFLVTRREGNFEIQPAPGKEGSLDEVYNACAKIIRDIDAQQIAQHVAAGMAQMAMQMQQQEEKPAIYTPSPYDMERLKSKKKR